MVSKYEAWLRGCIKQVVGLQSENDLLKAAFIRVLQSDAQLMSRSEAESFQLQLVDNDAAIALLRHELLGHLQRLQHHLNHVRTTKQQASLEKEILKMKQVLKKQKELLEKGANFGRPPFN